MMASLDRFEPHDPALCPPESEGDAAAESSREEALLRRIGELTRRNAELEWFACTVAHDLQEPLRMVGSYTQLLARRYRGRLDRDADEFMAFAVDGVKRMQLLIDSLLQRAAAPNGLEEPQPTSSAEVLSGALANLSRAIEESGASIRHHEMPMVKADPVQLAQIFQNLVANAIKFHGSAAPEVEIRCEEGAGEWRFSVADRGAGIDARDAGRVFQRFERLPGAAHAPGHGLGLAICRKIAEGMGGHIWVEPGSAAGATFCFTIPKG